MCAAFLRMASVGKTFPGLQLSRRFRVQNEKREGYSTMNSGNDPPDGLPGQAAADFRQRLEAWLQQFERCSQKPSRRRVHELRVFTQRLLAELAYCRRSDHLDAKALRTTKHWQKQGKKLRRALSSVREADVSLEMLARLRLESALPVRAELRPSPRCLTQIDRLEKDLERERANAAKALLGSLKEQRTALDGLHEQLVERLSAPMLRMGSRAASMMEELIAALEGEFTRLDGDNLHTFRKRVKQVRSLAEIAALGDLRAKAQAAALKKMQAATGAWRDCHVLANRARRAHADALTEILEAQADQALHKALDRCRRLLAKLGESRENIGSAF